MLGTRDLVAEALDLGGGVAVSPDAVGLDDGLEDPALLVVELDDRPAAAEDLGCVPDLLEPRLRLAETAIWLRPGRADQPLVAIGSAVQISSVTCGMTGWR